VALRKGAALATDSAVSQGRRVNDKQQRPPSSLNSQTRQISRPISSIHIGKRHRKDMGDIDVLVASMADLGLLRPIGGSRSPPLAAVAVVASKRAASVYGE
jgi:hypothetical protein